MAGFARYTQNYNTRLKDTPFYRKGARGADPLKSFVAKSHVNTRRVRVAYETCGSQGATNRTKTTPFGASERT